MRYVPTLIALFLTSLLVSCAAASPNSAGPYGKISDSANSDVKLSIAVVEGGHLRPTGVIHIIIENISDKPQAHFDEWNSFGNENISLEWTDAQGHSGVVTKIPRMYSMNFPSTTVLQPGESLVREVDFNSKIWEGWPEDFDRATFKLKAIYSSEALPSQLANVDIGYAPGWVGKVTSKEQNVKISWTGAP